MAVLKHYVTWASMHSIVPKNRKGMGYFDFEILGQKLHYCTGACVATPSIELGTSILGYLDESNEILKPPSTTSASTQYPPQVTNDSRYPNPDDVQPVSSAQQRVAHTCGPIVQGFGRNSKQSCNDGGEQHVNLIDIAVWTGR